ncbi:MAG: GNAT family N-acetyltransferase [bacterium]
MTKNKNIVVCRSDRLYLSPVDEKHAPALTKWMNDPEIFGHLRDMKMVTTVEQHLEWVKVARQSAVDRIFAIYYLSEDQLIGDGGVMKIDWENRKAEVGLVIGEKKYQGKGLGKEAVWLLCHYAFQELKLHNLIAEIIGKNEASFRLHEGLGFKPVGTRREAIWLGNRWEDAHYLDLLPQELVKPTRVG